MKRIAKFAALMLAVATKAAVATTGCWAADVIEPTSGDDTPFKHPKYAPLHAAMDQIDRLLRPNPGLLALPEVRLRMRREIGYAIDPARMPRQAAIFGHGFGPKAWGRGDCELIPQADRLGPRAGFSIFLNTPTATLNRWKHDEQLVTYLAKPATASFQGWPTFGECAYISRDRRLPWIAVSTGEMLAYEQRDQQRRIEAWDRDNARALEPYDPARDLREAEKIRAINAQAADAMMLGIKTRQTHEAAAHNAIRQGRARLVADLERLRAQQAGLDAAALAAPFRMPGDHTVVRLDPDFPWDAKRPMQVQLVTVCAPQMERNAAYHPPMRAALAALDFARLAALLQ
jgi:hypothetical protein